MASALTAATVLHPSSRDKFEKHDLFCTLQYTPSEFCIGILERKGVIRILIRSQWPWIHFWVFKVDKLRFLHQALVRDHWYFNYLSHNGFIEVSGCALFNCKSYWCINVGIRSSKKTTIQEWFRVCQEYLRYKSDLILWSKSTCLWI